MRRHLLLLLTTAALVLPSTPRPAEPPSSAGLPSPVGKYWPAAGVVLPTRAAAGVFRWPVDGRPDPVRRFDPPPQPWLPGHRGVDLLAPAGAAIRAAGAGTVLFAGPVAGRPVVTVGHADGLRTTYEPVQPVVTVGAEVSAGTALGDLLAGHAGCPGAACLHWGLRHGPEYLDPLALLGLGRVRLLPLAEFEPWTGGVNAGRAGRAAGRRAGRTPRPSCRPGRRAAANPARSSW
ncbi:peptidoglycan DD-metalloendopeptidase family protein [Micromonospora radicis]|uniref:M23 family peptidase n=1 Tax=Micromonospora radicis TaxID=1894971 RepID=A0A418N017_9ACTN|nr:peptidoglycan DD-metalloendopeptidase family protein [Micromonospora radicis]RIV40935.1 M23 family peptidase [Micromonospora radicis]